MTRPGRHIFGEIGEVASRECGRIFGRPVYLIMTVILPLFCFVFFASMMREGMPSHLPVAVIDLDNSALSRSIVRKLEASPQTKVTMRLHGYEEGKSAMQSGKVQGFIIFPRHMQSDAAAGRQPKITFYTTNSYMIAGSLLMRDLSTITAMSSASLNVGMRAAKGQTAQEITAAVQPIRLDLHSPGNPRTNYSVYLSTILSHGLLQILVLLTTVYAIGIEMKQGTSREWFATAGGSTWKALVGKLLPYTLLFSLMSCAGNTLFFKYLQFPCPGSFPAILLAGVMTVVAYQAMAVFILGLLTDFRISLTIAGVFGVLGLSFSGLTFPIEIMDTPLQGFSRLFPIRYYFYIYTDVALRGLPAWISGINYLILAAFILFPLPFARRLRRALPDSCEEPDCHNEEFYAVRQEDDL